MPFINTVHIVKGGEGHRSLLSSKTSVDRCVRKKQMEYDKKGTNKIGKFEMR